MLMLDCGAVRCGSLEFLSPFPLPLTSVDQSDFDELPVEERLSITQRNLQQVRETLRLKQSDYEDLQQEMKFHAIKNEELMDVVNAFRSSSADRSRDIMRAKAEQNSELTLQVHALRDLLTKSGEEVADLQKKLKETTAEGERLTADQRCHKHLREQLDDLAKSLESLDVDGADDEVSNEWLNFKSLLGAIHKKGGDNNAPDNPHSETIDAIRRKITALDADRQRLLKESRFYGISEGDKERTIRDLEQKVQAREHETSELTATNQELKEQLAVREGKIGALEELFQNINANRTLNARANPDRSLFEADDNDDDDDDDDDDAYNLYERLEHLLLVQANIPKAKTELRKFMEQHDYLRNLTEDNCVHLNLSMTFPPVVPLKPVLYRGRDYLRLVQKSLLAKPPVDEEEKQYYKQRILQERRLVDYQISQLRSSQKADVGFSLSSVVPPPSRTGSRNNQGNNPIRYQPSKWSMAVGCCTDVVYPGSAELARMAAAARDPKSKDYQAVAEKHPVTMFVNTSYHAAPTTQIFATTNLNNDNETHQYSLGSTHTFANQTACRYGMTILNRSPLPDNDPVIFNLKTYRHLQGIGTTAVGISAGSNGRMLQWNASWQATLSSLFSRRSNNTQQQQQRQQQRQQQASQQHFSHKVSAKASLGMLQGNSLEFGYKCKFPKRDEDGEKRNDQEPSSSSSSSSSLWSWLEDNFNLPKKAELTAVWGTFSKLTAIVTHEITSLATHPTLGFGLEHDISLGRWAWIWELHYNQSTFRIPISVVQLGSLTNYRAFYTQKLYYGMYCMFLQSIVTDLLEELGGSDRKSSGPTSHASHSHSGSEAGHASEFVSRNRKGFPLAKTKSEAEHQLALMKTVAEAKRYRETQRQASDGNGLIILTATYWHGLRHNSSELDDNEEEEEDQDPSSWVYEVVSMDATIQLQYWVKDGRFSAPGGIPKSSWMGFYTLATESKFRKGRRRHRKHITGAKRWLLFGKRRVQRVWNEWWKTMAGQAENDTGDNNLSRSDNDQEEQGPQLTVRYSYDGNVYEVTVGEKEALALPFEDHSDGDRLEVLGDAEFVQ